ncbi:response regulator [Clostridium sp. MCC353]|nr:response regulator [Clostridium sp. MCC353]
MESLGSGASIFLLNQEFTLLYTNPAFCNSVGYEKEEFTGCFPNFLQYFKNHPKEFNLFQNAVVNAANNGSGHFSVDCRMPLKNGNFIWMRTNGSITGHTADGSPVLSAFHTDISDLVHSKDLKSQYFEWMMDEYVGNVYISDMDTYELLYLNRVALETLQCTTKNMIGRKCYEVIQGRTSPCPFCTNDRLTSDEFYQWEFENPVLSRTFMIKNRMIDWYGHKARIELSHDMFSTEYKLAKKDRERDALLRTIPGGFMRLDARDRNTILWYGADFLNVIGYTEDQFEKELHSQCSYLHPEDKKRIESVLNEIQATGSSAVLEVRGTTHSGETRILTLTLCYASGENSWDGIPSFYSMCINMTKEREEQARQQKALEDAYQTARVANSAKTNFLSSMSHDIRTPMNAIIGMAAIARANLDAPDKVSDCLNKINVSSRHLLSLINEVLDMSKIESGKIDLMPEEIHLPELVQNIMDMCKPLISEKHLDFKVSASQVNHEKVTADGDRLQQVIMNLLSNAIKYTPAGGEVSLQIKEIPSAIERKGIFEFIISDKGIGISEEFLPHLFEPFSRADDLRISKIQGTGLGLTITENIVHMMNGSIAVKSRLGQGSQFTVSVQLDLLDEEMNCSKELEGLPVLVADDDRIVCESATALLNELGMRGTWVMSGAEAVLQTSAAHQRGEDFFAVILDWKMPGMDGLETLKAIRKNLGESVPVIIISAYDYSNIEKEFLNAGADAFITKPLFKSKMMHVLQLFLSIDSPSDCKDSAKPAKQPLCGKRILLAEDNELNREIAVELLQMHGLEVETAVNGQCAVDAFNASSPNYYSAVLMDIQMPVMNGYEAAAAIRNSNRTDAQSIPILALTANAFTTDVGKSYSVGMNEHIAKPIDIKQLIDILQKYIAVR